MLKTNRGGGRRGHSLSAPSVLYKTREEHISFGVSSEVLVEVLP